MKKSECTSTYIVEMEKQNFGLNLKFNEPTIIHYQVRTSKKLNN